jgi:hypothetical protein
MRRRWGVFGALFLAIAGVAIGVGAYNWGYSNGLAHNGATTVVRYVGPGFGFFPFGFFIVPLLIFGFIFFTRALLWRRPMYWGRGPRAWSDRFEDWHDRQHDHSDPNAPV